MAKQMSRNEALERIEFRVRHSCPEANGSNIGDCDECWRYPCNDMKALLVLRDLTEKERPHGEWVSKNEKYYCSNCKKRAIYFSSVYGPRALLTDFCPNCGADMREGEAE